MPLVFLFIGVVFLILARNGTQGDFESLLKKEFSGSQSFLVWASAFVILGLIGFWKTARPITDALIGLILFVLIVENKGFFSQFNAAIRNPVAPPASDALTAPNPYQPPGLLNSVPVIPKGMSPLVTSVPQV